MIEPLLTLEHLTDLTLRYIKPLDAFDVIQQLRHVRRLCLPRGPLNALARLIGDGSLQPISHSLECIEGMKYKTMKDIRIFRVFPRHTYLHSSHLLLASRQ